MSDRTSPGAQRLHQPLPTPCHTHTAWRRGLCAATAVGAVFAMTGSAVADHADAFVTQLNAPPIVVQSQGSAYTQVSSPAIPIEGTISLEVDAGVSGRVKRWKAWPMLVLPDGVSRLDFRDAGGAMNYQRPYPKAVDRDQDFVISKTDYSSTMATACIRHSERLRAQGLSNTQIFGQDRQVEVAVKGIVEYETTGIVGAPVPPEVRPADPTVTVNCKGHEPVETSSLEVVEQAFIAGVCRLRLNGRIVTTRPNEEVSFRYADEVGNQSSVITVRTNGTRFATFSHTDKLPSGPNSGRVRIIGVSSVFNTPWQDYNLDCNQATGITTVMPQAVPQPPEASVAGSVVSERVFQGFVCPDRISIDGTITARGLMATGSAAILLDNRHKLRQDFSVSEDGTETVRYLDSLTWGNPSGGLTLGAGSNTEPPKKSVMMHFKITDAQGRIIDTAFRRHSFACRPSTQSGQIAGNRLVTPQQGSGHQMVRPGGTANAQLARPGAAVSGFAIQAPQGRVRKGEIRLSGGQANANYSLRFYRKTGGSFQPVRSAQLPGRMRGTRANFDLGALSGSRVWRIEICPAGSTGIANAQSCKTSDFRLPRMGGARSGADAPVKEGKTRRLAPRNAN
ncbi:hypothetical protein [Denitrobaculum tricleocarpae]|uniref:Uncharacterized protein n=1 Tax=Denitrobaculum tricleocarpae TaxID=2591009 RepID=A0A545T0C7_9PROT|nr:hypothetical protein [Denitrobaculum tricleocarpae]TQV70651.1 hypothetical protein FKG95_27730 [Denitrobaculum tricleocarpae]